MAFLLRSQQRIGLGFSYRKFQIVRYCSVIMNENDCKKNNYNDNKTWCKMTTVACLLFGSVLYVNRKKSVLSAKSVTKVDHSKGNIYSAGERLEKLPQFTKDQVSQHDSIERRIWVTFKHGVYDITEFIPKHPGAELLLMAAGGSLEPFWHTYSIHLDNPVVYNLLEDYRIGNLHPEGVLENTRLQDDIESSYNPWAFEPNFRNSSLLVKSPRPFNAETPLPNLIQSLYTPNDLFYIRNHLPVPVITEYDYRLEVNSDSAKEPLTFSLADLKKLPKHTITATLQCGGNRRAEMAKVRPLKGLLWKGGAIGNASWGGTRLLDVLELAGVRKDDKSIRHVQFEGYDIELDGCGYSASIPIEKAFDGDVLLAYEMNGEVLPRDHGFPVRLLVPGVVGARSVKWLSKITFSKDESNSLHQQKDYKTFNPSTSYEVVDWDTAPAIQNMPVTSAICWPDPQTPIVVSKSQSSILLKGYAWSGGGARIIRVDVTGDQGISWTSAKLSTDDDVDGAVVSCGTGPHYGWTLWEAEVPIPKHVESVEFWSKAVDSNHNVQPESFENIWNLRGLLSNAYPRVTYKVKR